MGWGGVIGRLAGSSGQVGGYEMVGGVAETVGLLARSFGQGRGHGLWAGGGGVVAGVVGPPARSFGEIRSRKHGSRTMGSRW